MNPPSTLDRKGLMLGIGTYIIWGVLPLYIYLLRAVPALQLLAHRAVWSVLLLIGIVVLAGRVKATFKAVRGLTLLYLCASTVLIGINWLTYIYAVQHSHVLEASLGYFINPLLNVALGVLVLGERLRRVQGVAVGIATLGVLIMAAGGGALWVSLVLAGTFAVYGLIRKVAAIDALGGLTIETLLLAPLSLFWLLHVGATGEGVWGPSWSLNVMLILAGALTALPLLMFAGAARRMPYSTLGLVQYISPTLSFVIAVLVLGEPLHLANLIPFALIWIGCGLYCWDLIKASRDAGTGI